MFNFYKVRQLASFTLVYLALSATPSFAAVIHFDDMGDANAYIFNDFTGINNDSQGALLIGGNASFTGYTVGTLNNQSSLALSVVGNLNVEGGDINGLANVDGTAKVTNTNPLRETSANFNFNQTYFNTLSTQLSMQNNSNNSTKWSSLTVDTTGSHETYITELFLDQLEPFSAVFTTGSALGSRIVFNIGGEVIDLTSKDWLIKTSDWSGQHSESNVLFNFYQATELTINTSLYGSVLAPKANVIGNGGMINGQLIANSFTTGANGSGTQLNRPTFNVDIPPTPQITTKVSEPTALILLLAGLFAVVLRSRRVNSQAA